MIFVLTALLAFCTSALTLSDQVKVCVHVTLSEVGGDGKLHVLTKPTLYIPSGLPGFTDIGREMPGGSVPVRLIGILPRLLADGLVEICVGVGEKKDKGIEVLIASTVTLELNQQSTIRSAGVELTLIPSLNQR